MCMSESRLHLEDVGEESCERRSMDEAFAEQIVVMLDSFNFSSKFSTYSLNSLNDLQNGLPKTMWRKRLGRLPRSWPFLPIPLFLSFILLSLFPFPFLHICLFLFFNFSSLFFSLSFFFFFSCLLSLFIAALAASLNLSLFARSLHFLNEALWVQKWSSVSSFSLFCNLLLWLLSSSIAFSSLLRHTYKHLREIDCEDNRNEKRSRASETIEA